MLSKPSSVALRVKENEETLFVPVEMVQWIESANKYAVLHTANRSFVIRRTIRSLVDDLKSESFVRIHRSAVVRKGAVRSVRPLFHGDQRVVLTDGTALTLSRRYRAVFFAEMQQTSGPQNSTQHMPVFWGLEQARC